MKQKIRTEACVFRMARKVILPEKNNGLFYYRVDKDLPKCYFELAKTNY